MRPRHEEPGQRAERSTVVELTTAAFLVVLLGACHSLGPAGASDPPARRTPGSAGEAAEEAVAAPSLENTLRWKTASEVDNFGFDVYRGPTPKGPFERLTAEPIPGAGTTDEPQYYVFVDDTIEAGRPYWYFVESISMMGVRERFTPVFEAKPKGVEEAGAEETREPAVEPDREPGVEVRETGRRPAGAMS